MPLIEAETELSGIAPIGLPPGFEISPDPDADFSPRGPEAETARELLGAAFRQENLAWNAVDRLSEAYIGELDPTHNPFDSIVGTDLEPYAEAFVDSINQADTDRRIARIRRELRDRAILDNAGWQGTAARIGAGIFDLPTLLPGGAVVRGVRAGQAAARTAVKTGLLSGASATAAEAGLAELQAARPIDAGTAVGIGGSIVLGGLLGGALGAAAARRTARELTNLGSRLNRELVVPEKTADDIYGQGGLNRMSAVGAQMIDADVRLKSAFGIEKGLSFQDPLLRSLNSPFKTARVDAARMVETPMDLTGDIVSPGGPVETRVKAKQAGRLYRFIKELDAAYADYRFGKEDARFARLRGEASRFLGNREKMTFQEFKEQVALAARRGDKAEIPQVAKAAQAWRQHVAEPGKGDAIEAKLLPEDVAPETAESYLSRLYNKNLIAARRPQFERMLVEWMQRRQHEARNELKELEAEMAQAAGATEKPGKKAQAAALRKQGLEQEIAFTGAELKSIAREVTQTILSGQEGRILYRLPEAVRGPLRDRTLMIEDTFEASDGTRFEDFLENDIEAVARAYNRTLIPDVEITREFGDLDLTDTIRKINDEAAEAAERAPNEKERRSIESRRAEAVRDLKAMADRIRGTYGQPNEVTAFVRAGRVMRNLNYLRLLGGMTVSAIPDIARPVMVHGLTRVFRDAYLPLITNLGKLNLAREEARLASAGLDMVLDNRTMALADIMDDYGRHSRLERFLQGASSRFGMVSLMAPWNAAMKQMASVISMKRLLQSSKAMRDGKALNRVDAEHLAGGRIDRSLAERIADQFDEFGEVDGAVWLPNTELWTDKIAAEALRNAVLRDADRIIITPGAGDKPLWMSKEFGKLISQFKSFAMASVQRTLIAGLQQRDAAALNGAMMMMGLGTLVAYLKHKLSDRDMPEQPEQWAQEAFDQSGLAGWMFEANALTEKLTRGTIGASALTGKEVRRFSGRDVASTLLGPSAGLLTDLAAVTGAASSGTWSEADVRALRRTVPLQNLFYLRAIFNEAEQGIADALGAERRH